MALSQILLTTVVENYNYKTWENSRTRSQHATSTEKNQLNKIKGEGVGKQLTIGSCVSVRSSRYEARGGIWRARKMRKSCSRRIREQLELLKCSTNFPSASYLDGRTADAWTNCLLISHYVYASSNSYASFVLSKQPIVKCHVSISTLPTNNISHNDMKSTSITFLANNMTTSNLK